MTSTPAIRTRATPLAPTYASPHGLPQGTFAVDDNGQATYRVPIAVPPGIADHQPDLALVYSHRQANGILGVGWGLAGTSAITRTKPTYAVDGFTGPVSYGPDDRYALDGLRLINVEGEYGGPDALYYTEIQTWNHVRAGASATDGFTVTTKQGETWEYGKTTESRILTPDGAHVRVWALNARVDRHGNRIEYTYTQAPVAGGPDAGAASGAYYLARIAYTVRDDTPAQRFVDFTYEPRPDRIVSHVGGYPVITAYRLSGIAVSLAPAVPVRSYTLDYGLGAATQLSRIEAITEAGADPDAATLSPTRVVWQDVTAPGFDIGPRSTLDQHATPIALEAMDVNGGGTTDIVQLWQDTDGVIHATTYLATPGGDGVSYIRAADSTLDAYPETRAFFPADVDGDGRTDLIVAYKGGVDEQLRLDVYRSNGTGFDAAGTFETGDGWPAAHIAFFALDANGDGRTDLVQAYGHYDPDRGTLLYFRTYLSVMGDAPGRLFTPAIVSPTDDPATPIAALAFWAMDVNGDGMMDMVRVWQREDAHIVATAYVSTGTGLDTVSFAGRVESDLGTFSLHDQIAFFPVDADGDGTQDLLQVWQEPSSGGTTLHLTTFLGDAAGGFAPGPDSAFKDRTIDPNGLYPMGFTGGGPIALLSRWVSGDDDLMFSVFASSPSGVFRALPAFNAGKAGSAVATASFFAGDANGDGKADLIRVSGGPNGEPVLVPYVASGPYPDLVTGLTDPLGGSVAVAYLPLTDDTVYSPTSVPPFPEAPGRRYPNPLTPTQFPVQAVLGEAIYVVSRYTQTNDPARNRFAYTASTDLAYAGAAISLLGRGWEGFATVTRLAREDGRKTIQTFNQSFPLTGTTAATRTFADARAATDPRAVGGADLLLRADIATFAAVPRAAGATAGQHVLEVLRTAFRQEHYDYGADHFDYAIGQTFGYDDYGNVSRHAALGYIDPSTGLPLDPAAVVYRYNQYQNDVSAAGWVLGSLRHAKTSANATDADVTRFLPGDYHLSERTYAAETYDVLSSGDWDDRHDQYLTTTYGYDVYGNRTAETKPGGLVTRHDYDPDYHTFPMQTTTPPNAQGTPLVTVFGYDPRFGVEAARMDPNGHVFVTGRDAFGRETARQGPLPDLPQAQGDPNVVTPLVTGTEASRQAFRSATVVTTEAAAYDDDGQGGLFAEVRRLQVFPTDAARDFVRERTYADGLARVRETVQQTGQVAGDVVTLTDYDAGGKPIRRSLPFFSTTMVNPTAPHALTMAYDVLGRLLRREEPAGDDGSGVSVTTWDYGAGEWVTITEAAGSDAAYVRRVQHHTYDGHDKVARTVAPADGDATTVFTYDPLARLRETTDPATASNPQGVRTTITFDSLNRRLTLDDPDQNTTGDASVHAMTFAYDATTGDLLRQTDAAGAVTAYTYDDLGRILTRTLGDGRSIAYRYDDAPNGRGYPSRIATRAADGSVESQYDYTYDPSGNIATTALTLDGEAAPFVTGATFDPQKRLVGQESPDGTVLTRTYTRGQLVSQTLGAARVDYPLDAFNPFGKAGRVVYGRGVLPGSGIVTDYTFRPDGLVIGESVGTDADTVLQVATGYDLLKQIVEIADRLDPAQTQSFAYENKRLRAATTPGFDPGTYGYDASGNLVAKDGADYTYRAHFPTRMTASGVEVYAATQDACGRTRTRTANGTTLTFAYDGLGCLRTVGDATGELLREIVSDYAGRRLRETFADGTVILYISPTYQVTRPGAGSPTVTQSVLDDRGVAAAVATGPGAGTRYFRRDAKGSTTLTFDGGTGAVLGRAVYSGYGQYRLISGPDDFLPKYERRQWDAAIGLYCFGGRYYDPLTGRFLTPDAGVGTADLLHADALNRFAFELNNPVNVVDPTGDTAAWLLGLVIGLALIAAAALIIVSAGAATPLLAIGTGALLGAGLNASIYSVTHRDVSFGRFVAGYAINVTVGAALGAATGGAAYGLGAAADALATSAAESLPALDTGVAQGVMRGAFYAITGSPITAGADVFNQFMSNVTDNYVVGEHTSLSAGLARAAITGAVFGAVAGGLQGAAEGYYFRSTRGVSLGDIELRPTGEDSALLASRPDSPESFASKRWVLNTTRSRAILFAISESSAVTDASLEAGGL